jgi:hypothetical protein
MTLTEAAFWTKRFGVIAGVVVLVVGIMAIILTIDPQEEMPPQYMTANFACTETREEFLPYALEIPSLELANGSEMVFDIQTDSGKIDSLPNIINVYEFDNPTQSLNSQANAKIIANRLDFNPDAIVKNGTISYSWTDNIYHRELEVQAKNLNFTMTTDPDYIKSITRKTSVPSESEAKSLAVNFLRSNNLLEEDYSNGSPKTTYIRIDTDGSFIEAASASEADLIRVDLQRNKSMITIQANIVGADQMVASLTNKLGTPNEESTILNDERIDIYTFNTPITFLNVNKSNISVYVGAEDEEKEGNKNIYQVDYTNWPIESDACGTYELISPATAIEKVQAGEGSLIYLNELNGDSVIDYTPRTVKKFTIQYVNLTYFETEGEQRFLQPQYIISGEAILEGDLKADFDFAYPAINYDIVQNKIELAPVEVVEETTGLF